MRLDPKDPIAVAAMVRRIQLQMCLNNLGSCLAVAGAMQAMFDRGVASKGVPTAEKLDRGIALMKAGIPPSDAASRAGCSVLSLCAYATKLRKKGDRVPRFTPGPRSRPIVDDGCGPKRSTP